MPPAVSTPAALPDATASHGAAGKYLAQLEGYADGPESSSAWLQRARAHEEKVQTVQSADELLRWGVGDFTFVPGPEGLLGKGKFSSVYRVLDAEGKEYALKETALYPHHPLIATRLLREPELLGQIPPHPCLVGVEGFIKTNTHFYLVEALSKNHIALSDMPIPISRSMAKKLLDQLVSVVRDGLHNGGRVCHRDLKGENVLADPDGNIILLDLGLATHFSYSEPRLTTCCGSPAFHSPEIVEALAKPPGEVRYYGPELDIWCIALTILSLLTQHRYPIGTVHKSVEVMGERVKECMDELDALFPLEGLEGQEFVDWKHSRQALEDFLDIDGDKRMQAFAAYDVGEAVTELVKAFHTARAGKAFKTVTFIPMEIKYTLPLFLEPASAVPPQTGGSVLTFTNPSGESKRSIVSYVKYLLRSTGILYHTLPEQPNLDAFLQCVVTLPPDSLLIASNTPHRSTSLLDSIFGKRSSSVPASRHGKGGPHASTKKKHKTFAVDFWITVDCGKARERRESSRDSGVRRGASMKDPPMIFPLPAEVSKRVPARRAVTSPRLDSPTRDSPTLPPPQEQPEAEADEKSSSGMDSLDSEATTRPKEPTRKHSRPHVPRSLSRRPRASSSIIAGPIVTIHLSDARLTDMLRKALDQTKLHETLHATEHSHMSHPPIIEDEDAAIDRVRGRHRTTKEKHKHRKAQSTHAHERAGRGEKLPEHTSLHTAIAVDEVEADVQEDQRLETGAGGASGIIDGITKLFSREPRTESVERERPYRLETPPPAKQGMLLV